MHVLSQALDSLKNLSTVHSLFCAASAGIAPKRRPKINSHIHLPPNFSAFNTVAQAVESCAKQSLQVVGVANYYDYAVYGVFAELCRKYNIFPLFGVEVICKIDELAQSNTLINDPGNPGKMYLCGKGAVRISNLSSKAALLLQIVRDNDLFRIKRMTDILSFHFETHNLKFDLYEEDIRFKVARRHFCDSDHVFLQERHISQAFQEAFFDHVNPSDRASLLQAVLGAEPKNPLDPVAVQNDIRNHLMKAGKPAFFPEKFISYKDAREFILELGSIPCYPVLGDGARPLCGFEDSPLSLIARLNSMGIAMVEFIPNRNSPKLLGDYVRTIRDAGIPVLAGTEHNTLEMVSLEPLCLGNEPIANDLKEIFYEGACVVAAHQFLVLNDQCGFVDSSGKLNPNYKDPETRIRNFKSLGAALMEIYFTTKS